MSLQSDQSNTSVIQITAILKDLFGGPEKNGKDFPMYGKRRNGAIQKKTATKEVPSITCWYDPSFFLPVWESDLKRYKRLWQSVIVQAIQDLASNQKGRDASQRRHEALEWLTSGGRDFYHVCDWAGIEPAYATRKFKELIAHGDIGKKSRLISNNRKTGRRATYKRECDHLLDS